MPAKHRAWTLGYPPAYEKAIRIPGNGKAPGGYIFPDHYSAARYAASHPDARRYEPYEVEIPDEYELVATDDYFLAARARHEWHTKPDPDPSTEYMKECGVCDPQPHDMDFDVLLVVAPFINPDTGQPA